jgi:hypothetical protein
MYYLRITATIDHFRKVEKRKICDKIAGQFYLTRDEYIAQQPPWFQQDCWEVLATEWNYKWRRHLLSSCRGRSISVLLIAVKP